MRYSRRTDTDHHDAFPQSPRAGHCSSSQARQNSDTPQPHLAALSILLVGDKTPNPAREVGITAPAQTADLIDQLRATGTVLTYDPRDRTLRAGGHDALSVTIGKSR